MFRPAITERLAGFFVDSLSLSTSGKGSYGPETFTFVVGGTLRSLNNLLERLHQSFYYYLLPSPATYISIGDYMIFLGLVLFGFSLQLLVDAIALGYSADAISVGRSLLSVVATFAVGGLAPYVVSSSLRRHEALLIPIVLGFFYCCSILTPGVVNRTLGGVDVDRRAFLVFARVPVLLFVGCLSLLNFSFCFFASVVLMPAFIVVSPSRRKAVRYFQLVLLFVLSPMTLLYVTALLSETPFLEWLLLLREEHFRYGTFFFPCFSLVLLPLHAALAQLVWSAR